MEPTVEVPARVQNRACFQQWLGSISIDPAFFEQAISTMSGLSLDKVIEANEKAPPQSIFSDSVYSIALALHTANQEAILAEARASDGTVDEAGIPPYVITKGTAIIPANGPLSKQPSSLQSLFGGSSTIGMRKALSLAMADTRVERVMFHIDSPGGTVSGTGDLGDDIFAASSKKPIASFIEDMGTSAAYWLASQTVKVYASQYANVGSIGVIWTVYDKSQMYEKAGIKVHAVMSSPGKAFAVDGMPITKQQFAKMQAHVDETYSMFLSAVARGRGVSMDAARTMSGDADIYPADKALSKGLVDAVVPLREALADFAANTMLRVAPLAAITINGPTISTVRPNFFLSPDVTGAIALSGGSATTITTTGNIVGWTPVLSMDGISNTPDGIVTPTEHVQVTPEPQNPAGKPAAAPISLSPEEYASLQKDAKAGVEALNAVNAMKEANAKAAASALDSERERIMADYGLSKEQVQACPDAASLRALESVARSTKAQRSGADPRGAATGSKDATPEAETAAEIADFKASQLRTAATFAHVRPVEA